MKLTAMILAMTGLLITATPINAGPSADRTRGGEGVLGSMFGLEQEAAAEEKQEAEKVMGELPLDAYDGVWQGDDGRTVLLKRIGDTLYISGSDKGAAWHGRCIIQEREARCLAKGDSTIRGTFRYESDIVIGEGEIRERWKAEFQGGNASNSTLLKKR